MAVERCISLFACWVLVWESYSSLLPEVRNVQLIWVPACHPDIKFLTSNTRPKEHWVGTNKFPKNFTSFLLSSEARTEMTVHSPDIKCVMSMCERKVYGEVCVCCVFEVCVCVYKVCGEVYVWYV